MHPTDKAARIAGAIYPLTALTAPFSLIYVPRTLIVGGNATATANNIMTHETLFRAGVFADLISGVTFPVLASFWLYLAGPSLGRAAEPLFYGMHQAVLGKTIMLSAKP